MKISNPSLKCFARSCMLWRSWARSRADQPVQQLRKTTTPKTRPRGLPVFAALAERAGWNIARAVERPFSDQVVLT